MNQVPYEYNFHRTYFIDIDGTLISHPNELTWENLDKQKPLKNSVETVRKWFDEGHYIIITTARPSSLREFTIAQLNDFDIPYHQIVFGCTNGERIIINDTKPNGYPSVRAILVERNGGFTSEN